MRITRPRLIALTAMCLALTVAGVAHAAAGRSPSKTIEAYGDGYGPPGGSLPTYTVQVTNNSMEFQDIVLYQRLGDAGVPNAISLAWLTAPAWPSTTTTFTWKPEYSFMWSRTSPLQPGVTFRSEQTRAADPDDLNQNFTQFGSRGGRLGFTDGGRSSGSGTLTIAVDGSVPQETAALGFGMAGEPFAAVDAQPNFNVVMTPHPDYWIAAGTYTKGEVLDVEEINRTAALPFQDTFDLRAVLDITGNWTISR
jgi:rhizosphere induced protein